MEVTIIAETNEEGIHPVTAQMVTAAVSLGASPTVLCPGGFGCAAAAEVAARAEPR